MTQINTLIIDDEADAGLLLQNLLDDFSAINIKHVFTDALKALDAVILEQPEVILLDVEMPEISGIEFLKQLNKFAHTQKWCLLRRINSTHWKRYKTKLSIL